MPTDKNDINAGYERFVKALKAPRPKDVQKVDAKTQQEVFSFKICSYNFFSIFNRFFNVR